MNKKRFPEEFKIEAVKQVTERNHPVAEVVARLGVSRYSLYQCIKRYSVSPADRVSARRVNTRLTMTLAFMTPIDNLAVALQRLVEPTAVYFAKMSGSGAHSLRSNRPSIR